MGCWFEVTYALRCDLWYSICDVVGGRCMYVAEFSLGGSNSFFSVTMRLWLNVGLGTECGWEDVVFEALSMASDPLVVMNFVTGSVGSCDWFKVEGS